MRERSLVQLNASAWTVADDFYTAYLAAVGAPEWHGRNLDAIYDSLAGGINNVSPNYDILIVNGESLPAQVREFLAKVSEVFADARKEFGTDVSITLDSQTPSTRT